MAIKDEIRATRGHTARIRMALNDLPKAIAAEGFNDSSEKEYLREILQEIVGSTVAIADILDIEL